MAGELQACATRRLGVGGLVDLIRASAVAPIYNMPVIEQARWTITGQLDVSPDPKPELPVWRRLPNPD